MSTWSSQQSLKFWTQLVNHHSQWRTRTLLACVDKQCRGVVAMYHLRATSTIARKVKQSDAWTTYADWIVLRKRLDYPSPPVAFGEPEELFAEADLHYTPDTHKVKVRLVDGAWRSDDGSVGACCINEIVRHAPAVVAEGLIADGEAFMRGILFLNRTGIMQDSYWHSNGGSWEELLGGEEELKTHDRLWNAVLDEARSHCPNLRAAYAFGGEATAWFPEQPKLRSGIVNTANCCHPMHILMGAGSDSVLQYGRVLRLMASEIESGSTGTSVNTRWWIDTELAAYDSILPSLEEANGLSDAREQGRLKRVFGGVNETQKQRDARKKAGLGGVNETQKQRDARKKAGLGGDDETQKQRDARKKAGLGGVNETQKQRDARKKAAKKAGLGGVNETQKQRDARKKAGFGGVNETQKQRDASVGAKPGRGEYNKSESIHTIAPRLYAAGRHTPFPTDNAYLELRAAYMKLDGANKKGQMKLPGKLAKDSPRAAPGDHHPKAKAACRPACKPM